MASRCCSRASKILKLCISIVIILFVIHYFNKLILIPYQEKITFKYIENQVGSKINYEKNVVNNKYNCYIYSYTQEDEKKIGLIILKKSIFGYGFYGMTSEGSNYDEWMSTDDDRKILYIIYGYNPKKMADYYKVKLGNKTIKKSICNEEYFIHFYDQSKGVEENIKFYDKYGNDITSIIRNYK